MHLLICSKVSIPEKDRTLPAWEYTRSLGHTVTVEHPNDVQVSPDVIISMGVTVMEETFTAHKKWPNVPLFCYNWDCYAWVWTNPRPGEYDYRRYGELLREATEVWVPSECTAVRTKQWWPWVKDVQVILSACPWWDYENVVDDGYALCALREIPDPQWGIFARACEELDITYCMTKHECDYQTYQGIVAGCRLIVSHLYELSTGGLTLMEGYYLGKPCLLSDSPFHGGRDYLRNRGRYFRHNDYESFKYNLRDMWENPQPPDRQQAKQYIEENFSDQRMVDDMLVRIRYYTERNE